MATVYTDKQVKDFINGLVASGLTGAALQQGLFDGAVQYGIPYDQLARTTGYSLPDIKAYTQAKGVTLADTYPGVDPTTLYDVPAPPPAQPATPPPATPAAPPPAPTPPPAAPHLHSLLLLLLLLLLRPPARRLIPISKSATI